MERRIIEKINIAMMIRNPMGNPTRGSCAKTTGRLVKPSSAATRVISIDRIEAPITPTAI